VVFFFLGELAVRGGSNRYVVGVLEILCTRDGSLTSMTFLCHALLYILNGLDAHTFVGARLSIGCLRNFVFL
jgi:hypothetical protein